MVDINKLKEEKLKELNAPVTVEEVGLEDLIILGESKKIPIHILYPLEDGTTTPVKALIKQLTLKELDNIQTATVSGIDILRKSFFKSTGESWTKTELSSLPVGVVKSVMGEILRVSGVDEDTRKELMNF